VFLDSTSSPAAGEEPVVVCLELSIQYIHSYVPYLEAVSGLRKLWSDRDRLTTDYVLLFDPE